MSPLLDQLELPTGLVEAVLAAARRHGMEAPRLFGSMVTGDAGPESDVDLLVRLGEGRGWNDLLAFCEELEDSLGRPVDVVPEDGLSPYLRERVLAEAVEFGAN